MNLREYLDVSPEVGEAIRLGRAVVSLETTSLVHTPDGAREARALEQAVRAEHAVPAWTAVLDGVLHVGLSAQQLERLCRARELRKISRRDLPIAAAMRLSGATTAAAAMVLSSLAGIHVFSAGGIGAARPGAAAADVSADLQEIRQTPVAVVCSGVKLPGDTGPTLEYLETMGVPVLGLRTAEFPAFLCGGSGFGVDCRVETEADAARVAQVKWNLGLKGGVVIAVPAPAEAVMVPLGEVPLAVKTPSWVMAPTPPLTLQVTPPAPERRAARDQ